MAECLSPPLLSPQTPVECGNCDTDVDVTWYCKNCSASLCNSCKESHSKEKLSKKHEVVLRSRSVLMSHGSWNVIEPCKKHRNSDLVTYCNDCKVPCCIDCMEENHRRHDLTKLNTKYFEAESRLNSFVDDLSKSLIQTIQTEISILKQNIETINENFDRVNSELDSAEIKLKENVTQSFVILRKDLAFKQSKCSSDIEKKISSCENHKNEIESLIARTEQKIRAGGLDLIEYFPTRPTVPSFQSGIATPVPRFLFNESILTENQSNFGQIFLETSEEDKNQVSVQHEDDIDEEEGQDLVQRHTEKVNVPVIEKISTFTTAFHGRSIEFVGDKMAWVSCHSSDTILLYKETGSEVRSIKVEGSIGILGMAVHINGDIIVTCTDNKVRHVSVEGKITILIDTTPFLPRGVCLTDREEMYVVCMAGQGDKNHVALFTPDGQSKVREITVRDVNNKHMLNSPYCVVFSDGQIIVLNFLGNVVSVDQHSGKLLWVYDGSQARFKQKFAACGMCRDISALLLSDNNNHCIHFIDNKGILLKTIMVKDFGLERPWGLDVDSQSGKIWCGSDTSNKIVILRVTRALHKSKSAPILKI